MKQVISKETYEKIYDLLNGVQVTEFDCGKLCGAACCTCDYTPDDIEFTSSGDYNADNYMGIYLLPGEESVFDESDDWIDWGYIMAEEYEFPDSWEGKVHFVRCKTPPVCRREKRPIQCRTFPLAPHITEDGELHMIYQPEDLPYVCPLMTDEYELNEDFINATYECWQTLIDDPQIYDLVVLDSEIREEEDIPIEIVI